jgi:hypothetical protein
VKLRFVMMWVVFFELGISEFLKLPLGSVFCVCESVRLLGMCEF